MSATVRNSLRADREAEKASRWWRKHRRATATLFDDELRAAAAGIAEAPGTRRVILEIDGSAIRRVSLPKTGYHVYYLWDGAGEVLIVAIWHRRRGRERGTAHLIVAIKNAEPFDSAADCRGLAHGEGRHTNDSFAGIASNQRSTDRQPCSGCADQALNS